MVLLQTWSFSLILLFFILSGVISYNFCSNLPSRKYPHFYNVDDLKSCNSAEILSGTDEVLVALGQASQRMIDALFNNKVVLKNIQIWCNDGCPQLTELRINNLKEAKNLGLEIYKCQVESVVITSQVSELHFDSILLFDNPRMKHVNIGKIAKIRQFSFHRNAIIADITLTVADTSSFYETFDGVSISDSPRLRSKFLQLFEDRTKADWTVQPSVECRMTFPQKNFDNLRQCEKVFFGDLTFAKNVAPQRYNIQLKRIEGCFSIENTDLKSVTFLKGTTTKKGCQNIIENNELLCDYMDVLYNEPANSTQIVVKNNCKRCQINGPQENFDILSQCDKVVVGNLAFARKVTKPSQPFILKWIDGCFSIENTDLQSLGFLKGTTTKAGCQNIVRNNIFLCDVKEFRDNYPGDNHSLIYEDNCVCQTFNNSLTNFKNLAQCEQVLYGDLKFAAEVTPMEKPFHLLLIKGCITIENTNLTTISFLNGTKTNDDCENIIRNNIFLCDAQSVVLSGNSTLIEEDNCHGECQTFNQPIANFKNLSLCQETVYGDLTFAGSVSPLQEPIRLKQVKGCYTVRYTNLTTVSFLVGTKTNRGCTNRIIGNTHLCDYVDYIDEMRKSDPRLIFDNNCEECNTYDRPLTSFRKLSHCEGMVIGNVKFEGSSIEPMPRWINLERIHGCFEITNTELTTVKFLVGTRTRSDCVNVIKDNKYICDVAEVLNNIPEGTYIEAQNNCEKVCYDASEVWDKDCEVLHTISDVPISYVKQSKTLKRVHGPIKITSLKTETVDPSVLPQIEYDELVFRGNEFLCDEEAVRKLIPKGKKVSFKQNCWKRCPYPQILYGRKCTVFTGILDHRIFDNIELFERVLLKLEGVEGQIKIFGSNAQNLNFRKLKYVKNDKLPGPAILIENNKILKTVFLENLESVTSKTEPRIRIKHNGDFKFQAKDWQRIRNQTKTRLHKSLVVDIHRTKTKAPEKCSKDDDSSFKVVTPQKGILYWGALTLLIVLCIIVIIIFGLFCWFCYKVESGNY